MWDHYKITIKTNFGRFKSMIKMTTPSRKLRHSAEASLTVFISERERGAGGGGRKTPYFNVL